MADDGERRPPLRGIQGGLSLNPGRQQKHIPYHEFLIPHQDKHGHSAHVQTRILPDEVKAIEGVILRNKFPGMKTMADFLRWSAYRGLGWLTEFMELDDRTNDLHVAVRAMVEVAQQEMAMADLVLSAEEVEKAVNRMRAAGSEDRARDLVQRHVEQISQVKDEYWRDRALDVLRQKFGVWVERRK